MEKINFYGVNRNLRNSGKKYKFYSRKQNKIIEKEQAKIGPVCECKNKCMTKLNEKNPEIIPTLFKEYWALEEYNLQTAYLLGISERKLTEASKKLGDENQKRCKGITKYWVKFDNEITRVCRRAFASIHGIGTERVDYLNRNEKRNIAHMPAIELLNL